MTQGAIQLRDPEWGDPYLDQKVHSSGGIHEERGGLGGLLWELDWKSVRVRRQRG